MTVQCALAGDRPAPAQFQAFAPVCYQAWYVCKTKHIKCALGCDQGEAEHVTLLSFMPAV